MEAKNICGARKSFYEFLCLFFDDSNLCCHTSLVSNISSYITFQDIYSSIDHFRIHKWDEFVIFSPFFLFHLFPDLLLVLSMFYAPCGFSEVTRQIWVYGKIIDSQSSDFISTSS